MNVTRPWPDVADEDSSKYQNFEANDKHMINNSTLLIKRYNKKYLFIKFLKGEKKKKADMEILRY